MNPELPQVRPSVEAPPQIPGGVEYFPDGTSRSPESLPTYDRQPGSGEQAPAPAAAPIAVPLVVAPPVVAPAVPSASPTINAPATAGDDDLIEKEWVDKLKKIIAITKGNPYEQAKAIGTLQADYLKKRYDRNIGENRSLT